MTDTDASSTPPPSDTQTVANMPAWAQRLAELYESGAASQFLLHGNVGDRLVLPRGKETSLGSLDDFLLEVLLPGFDVVLSYDLGNGVRVLRGGQAIDEWRKQSSEGAWPRQPRAAFELLTRYFRTCANLARLGRPAVRVGCIVQGADLVAPALPGALNYDLHAVALLMRHWAQEELLAESPLVSVLISSNLSDLHPMLAGNTRAAAIELPQPTATSLGQALDYLGDEYPVALQTFADDLAPVASQLAGSTLASLESLLKLREHTKTPLQNADLSETKKALVEKDCGGLIEFIESDRTLDDLHGQPGLVNWLRQDVALWRGGDTEALPMGYLICGPVGTGKTYLVECLAGEAGIPVVKLKNFRDKWIGSTEGNLERIFRLIAALGRCYVFVDEADQTLGKRDSGSTDSGLSGRVYSMFAKEMSNRRNRGRVVWVLATSRPDLVEVDLKRPGRIDVKLPIFPAIEPPQAWSLLRALCQKRDVALPKELPSSMTGLMPKLLTPGAAESLAVKAYRRMKVQGFSALEAMTDCLDTYQSPISPEVMEFQMSIAVNEASDLEFIPESLRSLRS